VLKVVARDLGIDRGFDRMAADLALRRQSRPIRGAAREDARRDCRGTEQGS
jgi:hypothetical protein